jgi:cytochrome b subunit of formate dehydrogenase
MLGGGLAHIIWGSVTDRGRREIRELMPNLKDAGDALLLLGYYFGITAKPRYGRYSWVEKFEYFGVVWGSLVMAVTGIMLWFKEASTAIFPKWALDIAAVVHSYEGRLAFLTIIIWHFYNVIFSPDVFPASKVWLSGRISEHRMKEEHPLEYLKSQGTEESE